MTQADSPSDSVMARKISRAVPLPDSPEDRSTLRAMRLALARAASEELSLPMSVIGVRQARTGQGDLGDCLDASWLSILLIGPDQTAGAICLDRSLVTGIIQHQTTGQVTESLGEDRRFTATDAAMTAPLVDSMLARLDGLLEKAQDRNDLLGFGFCARADGPGDLLLSLSSEWYRRFNLTVEIGGGICQGQVQLLLPEGQTEGTDQDVPHTGPALDETFGVIRADLDAVLCRIRMSLADFGALEVDSLVPLAGKAFDQTELVSINGDHVAFCRLGQMNGMRAIRANETLIDDDPTESELGDFVGGQPEQERPVALPSSGVEKDQELSGFVEPSVDDIMSPEELEAELARLTDVSEPETLPALNG